MVTFGKDQFTHKFDDWTKHHKTIGIFVKRIRKDGNITLTDDPILAKISEKYKNELKYKTVSLYNHQNNEMTQATDYYLQLNNLDYIEPSIEYYSNGASNTTQTHYIRAKFIIEDSIFMLDTEFETGGTYAMSFADYISNDIVDELIENVEIKNLDLKNNGIVYDDGDYIVNIVTPEGEMLKIEMDKRELIQSCVGIELYKFVIDLN